MPKRSLCEPEPVPFHSNCKKVKDPCKICLQTVTPDTGLQCQGACEAWVHFECLNYTPGKIKDVEEGTIVVTCPCPDCKTSAKKEFLSSPPYTCNNVLCPANNPPACEETHCQANELTRQLPPRCPPPNTLRSCALTTCREYQDKGGAHSDLHDKCMDNLAHDCPHTGVVDMSIGACTPAAVPPPSACPIPQALPAPAPAEVMQQMCKTVGDLTQQLNCLMDKMKGMQGGGGGMKQCCSSNSSNNQGCGKKNVVHCTGACGSSGQSKCSQPCYCPGNPIQKR